MLAGLLSFLSPCVLPLVPAYLTVISGASVKELQAGSSARVRRRVLLNAVAFVVGFSCVFIVLGATATFAGQLLGDLRFEVLGLPIGLAQIGGVAIVIMGLHVAGWLPIHALYRVWNLDVPTRNVTFLGSFVVGAHRADPGLDPHTGGLERNDQLWDHAAGRLLRGARDSVPREWLERRVAPAAGGAREAALPHARSPVQQRAKRPPRAALRRHLLLGAHPIHGVRRLHPHRG